MMDRMKIMRLVATMILVASFATSSVVAQAAPTTGEIDAPTKLDHVTYAASSLDEPSPEVGFESIADNLVIVLLWQPATQTWDLYFPLTGDDTIGTLEAGRAYFIYVESDCTLVYGTRVIELYAGWNNPVWLGSSPDEIVLRPNTVVADEETEDVLTTVTEEQDVLTFGTSTPLLDDLKLGDVIIMGATDHTPNGLLRRVIDVTQDGEQVIVETEFATMEDVIEEGVVSVNATITAEDFEAAALGVDGIRVLGSAEGIGFSIDLSRDFDELSITGELAFRANPIIRVEGTWWRARLDELEFSIETDESLSIQIGTEASLIDVDKRIPLLPHPITKIIPFQAGPLPVVMTISFMPVLIVKADLSGQMNVWVGYECQRKAGLHYLRGRDPSWVGIEDETTDFGGGAELYVQANLQAWVGPEVTVKFYDVVGPTGNVWGYLEFEARLDPQLQWDLHGGLQATLGVRVEFPIFGWTLGINPVEVMHYRWLLAEYRGSEQESIELVGELTKDDVPLLDPWDIAVRGQYAYVTNFWYGGLHVIDVADPADPRELSYYPLDGQTRGVTVSWPYAYVAATGRLHIFDVSEPTQPVEIASIEPALEAFHVTVAGTNAYVVARGGTLTVVDVADPAAPVVAGNCSIEGTEFGVARVEVDGDYAYLLGQNPPLVVIDVSVPSNPSVVGVWEGNQEMWPAGLSVQGRYAFITAQSFNSTPNALYVVDVADPDNLQQVGFLPLSFQPFGVVVKDQHALIAGGPGKNLVVLNISDPTAPVLVAGYQEGSYYGAMYLVVDGDYAYVANRHYGLLVFRIV